MALVKSGELTIPKPRLRRMKLTKAVVGLPAAALVAVAVGLLQLGMVFYLREVRQFSPVSIALLTAGLAAQAVILALRRRKREPRFGGLA